MHKAKLVWQPLPVTIPKLQKNSIHVWRISLNSLQARLGAIKSVLSVDETIQAAKFKFLEHQQRFIIARGMLRYILSYYLKQLPEKLIFQYSAYGKPYLADQTIHFNLTHSGQWVLYAIGLQEKIGIDIEQIRKNMKFQDVAKRFFSVYENQQLSQTPETQKTATFFHIWTCKEAFIKAIGRGLSCPLKEFDVDITKDQPRLVRINCNFYPPDTIAAEEWSLIPLWVAKNYSAVAAVQAQINTIKLLDFI